MITYVYVFGACSIFGIFWSALNTFGLPRYSARQQKQGVRGPGGEHDDAMARAREQSFNTDRPAQRPTVDASRPTGARNLAGSRSCKLVCVASCGAPSIGITHRALYRALQESLESGIQYRA